MSLVKSRAGSRARSLAIALSGASSGVPFPDLGTWQFRTTANQAYTDAGTTLATTLGQQIMQMNAIDGSNHLTQPTAAKRPVYVPNCAIANKPAVRFQQSNPSAIANYFSLPAVSVNSRAFSFYFVGRCMNTGTNNTTIYNFGSEVALSNPFLDINEGLARQYLPLTNSTGQFVYGNPLLYVFSGDTGEFRIYRNTTKETLPAYTAASVVGGLLFERGDTSTPMLGFDLYECGLIDTAFADADVAEILAYAASEYGVQTSWTNFIGFCGDSLTRGAYDTGNGTGKSFPLLVADSLGATWKCCNGGENSTTIATLTASAVWSLNRQVVGVGGRKVFCNFGGTNDLAVDDVSLATLQSRLTTMLSQQTAAGFNELYVATIAPRGDYPGFGSQTWSAGKETKRNDYNAWLRTQVGVLFDDVIDLDTVTELDDPADTAYYYGDYLHWKQPIRDAVAAKVLSTIG